MTHVGALRHLTLTPQTPFALLSNRTVEAVGWWWENQLVVVLAESNRMARVRAPAVNQVRMPSCDWGWFMSREARAHMLFT